TAELTALAEQLGIPVITSMIGQGSIRNDHSLYFGFTGTVGTPAANELARTADVALAVGTRFGELDCNSWLPTHFFPVPDCKLIQIDIDPNELGKVIPVELGIAGDAQAILGQMHMVAGQCPAVDWQHAARFQMLDAKREVWEAELHTAQQSDNVPIELDRIM